MRGVEEEEEGGGKKTGDAEWDGPAARGLIRLRGDDYKDEDELGRWRSTSENHVMILMVMMYITWNTT